MGIIKRQSIKQSIANYFGVAIGAISTLFIFPYAPDEIGLLRFLVATATIALPFVSLGVNGVVIRFFPEFQNKTKGHNGFLGFVLSMVLSGFIVFLLLVWGFKDNITNYYSGKPPEYLEYLPYAIPLVLFIVLSNLLKLYTSNFHRVVVPFIVYELFLKIAFPLLILLFLGGFLAQQGLVWGLLGTYFLIVVMLMVYLGYLGELHLKMDFSFYSKERLKHMGVFAFYGMLGSLGGILALQIDVFMVANMTTLYAAGVYSMSLFIANVIDVPTKAIFSITSPIISKAWKENNTTEINSLYKKTSINLLLPGCFLFLLIWLNLDDLFSLLPKGDVLAEGKYVILLLGLSKVIDQLTSINSPIIAYSKYFRFNFIAVLLLSVLNITLNILLIPEFHIAGAAMASMISLTLFNAMKVIFIKVKLNMHPFTRNTLWSILLAVGCYLVIYFIPKTSMPFINMAINSVLLVIIFGGFTLYYNLSPEITNFVEEIWTKVKQKVNRK